MADENLAGEKTRTEKEWDGLMTDKQNEVRTRQQLQSESGVKDLKITELRSKITELEASPKAPVKDPTENVTRGEMVEENQKTKKELIAQYEKEKKVLDETAKKDFTDKSFNAAIKLHTEKKEGKGLSFDEVMEGTKREILKNSTNRTLIENDTNPGEKAYQIGLQDSVIAERAVMYKKTLAEQKKAPKTGMAGTTIPGEYYSLERVKKMTRAQIKEHYAEIQESRKTWNK